MAGIEQIVDRELVVTVHVDEIALDHGPVGVFVHPDVGDQRFVGERRIAHPDPDPTPALDNRIRAHALA